MQRTLLSIMVGAGLLIGSFASAGGNQTNRQTQINASLQQLGRGTANFFTGLFIEVPENIRQVKSKRGDLAGSTYGFYRGISRGLTRHAVGLFEIFTCPAGFDPIIHPEYPGQENGVIWTIFNMEDSEYMAKTDEWRVTWPESEYKNLQREMYEESRSGGFQEGKKTDRRGEAFSKPSPAVERWFWDTGPSKE